MQRAPRVAGVRLLDSRTMEKDEVLIEAVQDCQCLYNSKSTEFKVVLKKENTWTAIAAKLERTGEQRYRLHWSYALKIRA